MFVGTNPLVSAVTSYIAMPMSNMRIELRERKDAGLKVIVIDPRVTETAQWADIHLRPAARGGCGRARRDGTRHDRREPLRPRLRRRGHRVGSRSSERPSHRSHRSWRTAPVYRRKICSPPRATLAQGPRGCAVGGTGINMAPHPILSEYLLLCLNTLCGRYRRAGEVVSIQASSPEAAHVAGPRGPKPIWGKGDAQPRVRGLTTNYDQMPAAALSGRDSSCRARDRFGRWWCAGGNPLVALPDQAKTLEAFDELELLVSLDVDSDNPQARSDYVVGCTLSLEKADATVAHDLRFPSPFAESAPPVIEPEGDVIDEWEFFCELAQEMGTPWTGGAAWACRSPSTWTRRSTPTSSRRPSSFWRMLCGGARISFEDLLDHPHGWTPPLDPVVIESGSGDVRRTSASSLPTRN